MLEQHQATREKLSRVRRVLDDLMHNVVIDDFNDSGQKSNDPQVGSGGHH
jgi:hypothetical protein